MGRRRGVDRLIWVFVFLGGAAFGWVAAAYVDYLQMQHMAQFILDTRRIVELERKLCESPRSRYF